MDPTLFFAMSLSAGAMSLSVFLYRHLLAVEAKYLRELLDLRALKDLSDKQIDNLGAEVATFDLFRFSTEGEIIRLKERLSELEQLPPHFEDLRRSFQGQDEAMRDAGVWTAALKVRNGQGGLTAEIPLKFNPIPGSVEEPDFVDELIQIAEDRRPGARKRIDAAVEARQAARDLRPAYPGPMVPQPRDPFSVPTAPYAKSDPFAQESSILHTPEAAATMDNLRGIDREAHEALRSVALALPAVPGWLEAVIHSGWARVADAGTVREPEGDVFVYEADPKGTNYVVPAHDVDAIREWFRKYAEVRGRAYKAAQ